MVANHDKVSVRRLLRHKTAPLLLALLAAGAMAPSAFAVSFRCPHNGSVSEKLICSDPNLSSLDDKLAIVYKRAKDAAPSAEAIEADRVAQWQWRQRNCKDKACLSDWYQRRIRELEADFAHGLSVEAANLAANMADQNIVPAARPAVLEIKGLGKALSEPPADHGSHDGAKPAPCTFKENSNNCLASSAHQAVLNLEKSRLEKASVTTEAKK
ncbi:hypothetical protein FAZ95_13175 [Trinickia violacea]|uniref:DUF1311 domain-containing protein n=1 Tax=Trinickia violacea TaxID=2571746 RepID=A0A4P8IP12_9BURK|nr:hypothetical protein [Trinickia violacea]QCP50046.1 hypothetical protein FAZ95_13175 [Trinickia violacea]